jgi:hypothetical protein
VTSEQIDALVAGRELDALVAEKVMGYKPCPIDISAWDVELPDDPDVYPFFFEWKHSSGVVVYHWGPKPAKPERQFAPSRALTTAWGVVEKVALPFDLCNTLMQAGETKNGQIPVRIEWRARFLVHDRYVNSISATVPLAICRAALKVVV